MDIIKIRRETEKIRLSPNFTLWEMLESEAAINLRIAEQFEPSPQIIANLGQIAKKLLQPIRTVVGLPITVNSGYRCPKVNTIIGGSRTSQHPQGEAADITLDVQSRNGFLFERILQSGVMFDQLIWEFGTEDFPQWVHISLNLDGTNRKQVLRAFYNSKSKKAYKKFDL